MFRHLGRTGLMLAIALTVASCGGSDTTSSTSTTAGGPAYLAAKIAPAKGGDGVAVAAVAAEGAADAAGVKPGDVILAIDGTPTKTDDALVAQLAKHSAGDTVELTVDRGGNQLKLTATLDERPATVPD